MQLKYLILIFSLSVGVCSLKAQQNLRDSVLSLGALELTYSANQTFGDLVEKTDLLHMITPSLSYKNSRNWIFKGSFGILIGHSLKQNETPFGVYSELQLPISVQGNIEEPTPRFQGYSIYGEVGKIIRRSRVNENSGFYASIGYGFIQHKINIEYGADNVAQLEDPYIKGYDRLTNGSLLKQFIGWRILSNKNYFNYTIGIESGQGFTRNRRSFNYDTRRAATDLRLDFYIGIKAGIIIPFYGV